MKTNRKSNSRRKGNKEPVEADLKNLEALRLRHRLRMEANFTPDGSKPINSRDVYSV